MELRRFLLLYLICLGASLGVVRLLAPAEAAVEDESAAQRVAEFIAVPPKPDGADRNENGDGEAALYSWSGCLQREGEFRDACFRALAWQWAEGDPDGALESCDMVEEEESRWECYSDVAELHAPTDRARSEAICPLVPMPKWRDQCWFGVALAFSHLDYEYARATCERAGRWRDFCRHDVNGEISEVDPDEALRWCKLEEGSLLQRKTCFHGLGKYMARQNPQLAVSYCERVPTHEPLYMENCFHGVGWSVAEARDVEGTKSFCRGIDGYSDSCLLGLSANAKRVDPALSEAVCRDVERSDLRERCVAFARRPTASW